MPHKSRTEAAAHRLEAEIEVLATGAWEGWRPTHTGHARRAGDPTRPVDPPHGRAVRPSCIWFPEDDSDAA